MRYLIKVVNSSLQFYSRLRTVISIEKRIQKFFERNILFDVPDRLKEVFLEEVFNKKRLEDGEFCKICEKEDAFILAKIRKRLEFKIEKSSYMDDFIRSFATIYAFLVVITIIYTVIKYKGIVGFVNNLLKLASTLNSVFSFVFVCVVSVFLIVKKLSGEFQIKFYLKKALKLVELVLDSKNSKIGN